MHALIFYSLWLAACYGASTLMPPVDASVLAKVGAPFGIILAVSVATNNLLTNKIFDLHELDGINIWSLERLQRQLLALHKIAKQRFYTAISFCVVVIAISAYGFYLGDVPPPFGMMPALLFCVSLSVYFLFVSIIESENLKRLESDLKRQIRDAEANQKLIDELEEHDE